MNSILIIIFYTALAFLVFGKLPFTFFLQDEWVIFGSALYWDKTKLTIIEQLFTHHQQITHMIPFARFAALYEFKIFGLNFTPYGLVSIGLHVVNAVLVFWLANTLLKKKWISFLAGLFFLINFISSQAVVWVATTIGTVGSTTFALSSLIFYAKYVLGPKQKRVDLMVSLILFFISLGFHERTLFLFIFFPIFWLVYQKNSIGNIRRVAMPLLFMVITYISLRVFLIVFSQPALSESTALTGPSLSVFGIRLFSNSYKVFTQSFMVESFIIRVAEILVGLGYPQFVKNNTPDPFIVQSVGVDIISFLGFVLIIGICILLVHYFRNTKEFFLKKSIYLSLAFILLSSLPLMAISGKAGYFSLVDGRYQYITSIGSSILLSLFFYWLYRALKKLHLSALAILSAIAFIGVHGFFIRTYLNSQVQIGVVRKSILDKVSTTYPLLSRQAVFYIESDTAYYGLSDKILPFQTGLGQVLLVWYDFKGQRLPACMFQGQFLYQIVSEGYRECDGRGFGYFRNLSNLEKAVVEHNISSESIFAFRYNSATNELIDISDSVRAHF